MTTNLARREENSTWKSEAGQGSVVDRGKVGGIAKLGCHMKAFADGSMELFQFNKFSHKNQRESSEEQQRIYQFEGTPDKLRDHQFQIFQLRVCQIRRCDYRQLKGSAFRIISVSI